MHVNWKWVVAGGVAAGVIIDVMEGLLNGLLIGRQWEAAMASLGRSAEMTVGQLVAMNVWGLLLGGFAVWLFTAITPGFGETARTAACAGTAVWFVAYVLSMASGLVFGIFPVGLTLITIAWGLPELVLATMAGAWVYHLRLRTAHAGPVLHT